jgi:hypothetical protein
MDPTTATMLQALLSQQQQQAKELAMATLSQMLLSQTTGIQVVTLHC